MRNDPNKTFFNAHLQKDELQTFLSAVSEGKVDVVREYLDEYGVNICNAYKKRSITLLGLAASKGRDAVVTLLLDAGMPVQEKFFLGRTALHEAAGNGHTSTANLLLDRDADINLADRWGRTPLAQAVTYDQIETAKMLLERGASPNPQPVELKDNSIRGRLKNAFKKVTRRKESRVYLGQNLLLTAAHKNNIEMARLLIQHGVSIKGLPIASKYDDFMRRVNAPATPTATDAPKP